VSEIISDEEIRSVIVKKAKELEAEGKLMSPMEKFREAVKAQRDASDIETREEFRTWINLALPQWVVDRMSGLGATQEDCERFITELIKIVQEERDQEWVEWVKQHRWEIKSLIPGIDMIKGYLIKDEELQAIRLQAIRQKMEGG